MTEVELRRSHGAPRQGTAVGISGEMACMGRQLPLGILFLQSLLITMKYGEEKYLFTHTPVPDVQPSPEIPSRCLSARLRASPEFDYAPIIQEL